MVRWYYSTNGKAEGPVEFDFLVEQLKAGKFTLVDLVFKEGEAAWKTFGEIPELRAVYQAPPPFVPPVPPQAPPQAPFQMGANEITLDEISIDEFTPTPILSQVTPAAQPAPVIREEPVHTVTVAAPVEKTPEPTHEPVTYVEPISAIVVPESTSVKEFEKPQDGWPSDWRLSSSWIVLRKKYDGSGYEQEGPYSAEHIIEMIGEGKIEYAQYCWKPGYTRWFRIGNLPEFDRRKRDRDNDTVNQIIPVPAIAEALPALTREELLANVERLRRDKREKERAPVGTTGRNLVETPIDRVAPPPPTKKAPEPVIIAEPKAPEFDRSAIAPMPAEPPVWQAPPVVAKKKMSPKTMRIGIAAFVAILFVAMMLQFASSRGRQPASQQQPPPNPQKTQPQKRGRAAENEAAPSAAPPVATATVTPPHVASSLEIVPKDLEGAAVLAFTSDMDPADKIVVKIKGHTGDVLNVSSYWKTFEVSGATPQLDLVKEGVPAGTLFVEASVGTAQSSTQIFVGKKDDHFSAELEHHIKSISLRQQSEKNALFYGARSLEKLAKDLKTDADSLKAQPLKWTKAYKAWRMQAHEAASPVSTLASSPANDIAYPDQIAAFQSLTEKLAAQAKEFNDAITQKRDVASASADDMSVEFGKLREDSGKLSGRPQAAN